MVDKSNITKTLKITSIVVGGALSLFGLLPVYATLSIAGIILPSVYDIFSESGIFKSNLKKNQIIKAIQNTYENLKDSSQAQEYEKALTAVSLNIQKAFEDSGKKRKISTDEFIDVATELINQKEDAQSLDNRKIILDFEREFLSRISIEKNDNDISLINIDIINERLNYIEAVIAQVKEDLQEQIDANTKAIAEIKAANMIQDAVAPPYKTFKKLFGRERDIKEVIGYLHSYQHIVIVNGWGGVGKTELSAKICDSNITERDHIYWFKCNQGLNDGIKMIAKPSKEMTQEEKIENVKQFLMRLDYRYLLVFDNLEDFETQDIDLLRRLNCKVIITSRKNHNILTSNTKNYYLDLIDEKTCCDIFKFYCKNREIKDEKTLTDLVRRAGKHTLVIELLARLYDSPSKYETLAQLYDELKANGFNLKDIVSSHQDINEDEFRKRLLTLFDISKIKDDDDEIHVLKNICILPSMPVPFAKMSKWLDDKDKYSNALSALTKSGWLKCEKNYISMHSVISETLRMEFENEIDISECKHLIYALAEEINLEEDDPNRYKAEYMPFCISISEYFSGLKEEDVAYLNFMIASVYDDIGEYSQSLKHYNLALEIKEKVLGKEHPNTATTYNNIAGVYQAKGDYDTALRYFDKALEISEIVLGKEHPDTATTYNNLAGVYQAKGDYDKALIYYHKALEIREKVSGKEHPDTSATYNNIAVVYQAKGDYDKALRYYDKALEIREKVLGKDHPSTATTYNNIAGVYQAKGDYDKALRYYDKALEISEKVLGKEHPDTATIYNNIALVYHAKEDYDKALIYYDKALEISEKVLGKEHPDTAITYNNIAGVYKAKGDYDKALRYYDKDLEISEKVLGKEHPSTAITYNNIAVVYQAKGDYDTALSYYDKALKAKEKVLGKEHPSTATSYNNIAGVYKDKGDYDKALRYYDKALNIVKVVLGAEHPDTAATYNNIAGVYQDKGDYDTALPYYDKALNIVKVVLGAEHPYTASTYNNIEILYKEKEAYEKAQAETEQDSRDT
ncbi:MAG: tetratricopeptide repeat protein [Eubacteriales bacterium]